MNRLEAIEFCNNLVFPLFDYRSFDIYAMRECVKKVKRWRIGKHKDIEMVPSAKNGCLYINGEYICRVTDPPHDERLGWQVSNEPDYEEMILARAESYYCD